MRDENETPKGPREEVMVGRVQPFSLNFPRSVLAKRAFFPLTLISLRMDA